MNLYQYLGSNPISGLDPSGLDVWDDFDEAIEGVMADKLNALGMINEGAHGASIGLNLALDIAGAILGVDVFESVGVIANGGGGFWDSMNILMAATPIGKAGKIGGIIGKAARLGSRSRVASKVVGTALDHMFKILPYGKAKNLTRGFKNQIQAHKLLEWRHVDWGTFRIPRKDIPAVILPKGMHDELTTILQRKLRTGQGHGKEAIRQAYERVYREIGHPEWLDPIRKYFQ
jgi:hypothetical protein